MAIKEIAINSKIDASIKKTLFEVLYRENIPLPVDLLLSRESSINPYAHTFSRKMKYLVPRSKILFMMLNKLKSIFMMVSIRTRPFFIGDMVLL